MASKRKLIPSSPYECVIAVTTDDGLTEAACKGETGMTWRASVIQNSDATEVSFMTGELFDRSRLIGSVIASANEISTLSHLMACTFMDSRNKLRSALEDPSPEAHTHGFLHIDQIEGKQEHFMMLMSFILVYFNAQLPSGTSLSTIEGTVSFTRVTLAVCHANHRVDNKETSKVLLLRQFGFKQVDSQGSFCKHWYLDCGRPEAKARITQPLSETVVLQAPPLAPLTQNVESRTMSSQEQLLLNEFKRCGFNPGSLRALASSQGWSPQQMAQHCDGSRLLLFAVASLCAKPGVTQAAIRTVLDELVAIGANPLIVDLFGNNVLHVAAGTSSADVLGILLASADVLRVLKSAVVTPAQWMHLTSQLNRDRRMPWEEAQAKKKSFEGFVVALKWPSSVLLQSVGARHDMMSLLMPPASMQFPRTHSNPLPAPLIDGWLSPRTKKALSITSSLLADMNNSALSEFTVNTSKLVEELCTVDANYLPLTAGREVFKSFVGGWAAILDAVSYLFGRGSLAPSVSNVKAIISRGDSRPDHRYLDHYYGRGGTIEHALNAVIDMTQICQEQGDCGWEWVEFEDQFESLPETPFDYDWALVRVKLMELEGAAVAPNGVQRRYSDYDLSDGNDSDDEDSDEGGEDYESFEQELFRLLGR